MEGKELRDHFAGLAIQGMLANFAKELLSDIGKSKEDGLKYISDLSYAVADKMMLKRDEGNMRMRN